MYIAFASMYIDDILATKGSDSMTTATKRTHKHFQLDSAKIKRAPRSVACKNGDRGHRACSGLRDCGA